MGRILNFVDNRYEVITLDELKQTVDERSSIGEPFNGIVHWDLWGKLLDLTEKRNVKTTVEDIFATDSKNKILPGVSTFKHLEETYGRNDLRTHLLRRVIGKIGFPEYSDNENNSGIAINFHQGGIELAYGMNVKICSNLSIYGNTFITSKMMNLDKMFDVFEDWLFKLDDFRKQDISIMNEMKETFLDPVTAIPELIGKLSILAVKSAYLDSKLISPLNIGQVSTFTKNLLKRTGDALKEPISVWELTNIGTDILKPTSMAAQEVLSQTNALGNFFNTEYLKKEIVY